MSAVADDLLLADSLIMLLSRVHPDYSQRIEAARLRSTFDRLYRTLSRLDEDGAEARLRGRTRRV